MIHGKDFSGLQDMIVEMHHVRSLVDFTGHFQLLEAVHTGLLHVTAAQWIPLKFLPESYVGIDLLRLSHQEGQARWG
jgi:hypothetical protein